MKLSFDITLAEMADILRKYLTERHSCEVLDVRITSYGKTRIVVQSDGIVEGTQFRHDSTSAPL